MSKKKITIVGLGYIGLPTAVLLASIGYRVNGIEVDKNKIEQIKLLKNYTKEPNLTPKLRLALKKGNLKIFSKPQLGDIYIICVPTPLKKNSKPDLKSVFSAAKSIAKLLKPGNMVVLESTSPVGTTKKINKIFLNKKVNLKKISIAYCPERVLPGNIMNEMINNDRVVGGINQSSTIKVVNFYKKFTKGQVLATNAETAELCKLCENSFRDVNIAFANELSRVCEKYNINIGELIKLANRHPRVNILQPGIGVGGHCIPIDPHFVIYNNLKNTKLLRAARMANISKTNWVIRKIVGKALEFKKTFKREPVITCYGLTYKENVNDTRESPAKKIYNKLIKKKLKVTALDPYIRKKKALNKLEIAQFYKKSDINVLLVKHKIFLKFFKGKETDSNKYFLYFSNL